MKMKTKELELLEKIERRLETIHAHTKLGKTIREVIKEFGICRDTYLRLLIPLIGIQS